MTVRTNMREMKQRSLSAKLAREAETVRLRHGVPRRDTPPEPSAEEPIELSEDDALEDGGDGAYVVRRGGSRRDEADGAELPSEPPPGVV